MSHEEIAHAVESAYGLSGSIRLMGGENESYLIELVDGEKYILKFVPESYGRERIQLEQAAIEAVFESDIGVDLPRLVPDRSGDTVISLQDDSGMPRLGRLMHFVSGEAWGAKAPASDELLTALGDFVAHMVRALSPLDPPAAHWTHMWDLAEAGAHRSAIALIDARDRRRLLTLQFERWAAYAQDMATVPHGLIHGDLNDDNLLVTDGKLSGLLDFGDALYNPLICDLAIALTYALIYESDPWRAGAQVVAGYHSVRPLSPTEVELLYPLICGRLAVSLVMSAKRRLIDPDRAAWFETEKRAWAFLEQYGDLDPTDIADRLAALIDVCPFQDRGVPADDLLVRRRAVTSAAQSIFYNNPIKFVRGRGAYLIDERGRPFLDLYNNVCHVGHCHPRVVRAGQEQMARLNTNTRYLTEAHVAYAERLAETLPPPLDTVFLVNSGTEANELALRLAYAHTGHEDVVVVDNAYHGHTRKLIDVSPYKFMGQGGKGRPEPWVHIVPIPDGYRGEYKGHTRETGISYGDEVGTIIQSVDRPIAAFLAETLPSVGGQIIPPPGYFETAFEHVRAAGGVCILDEVQVGFGRIGTHFWAFEIYDVVPDIVVMGKPIGNGHPIGAVVCTSEIARSFAAAGMEFFSTFGGNPVSCAIGNAVLDVIEDEGLQEHARTTGVYFLDALHELERKHECIGDVRGVGLFLGIELVESDGITPATQLADQVINALREERILVGTDGPFENVIKLKPPMVVTSADVDRFIEELDLILASAGLSAA
ncbi:MAG: aminotransferase class III-fold pyridoxal phosphate-dependent enzyme [Anaerolineales bacterium]